MEIIVRISLLFWAVYLNYCALTHIPQTQSRVHAARENNWLIVANKNWLHKPTVSASPELMLGSGSPDIEHMKRVIRIRNENHIALLAARHSWRATTALHNVNVMRNYWVIIKRYCHLFLFLFWLLSHLLRQLGTALICEVIFLHEFLGVQVPHKELTVIGSREKATSLFGVVDCPHVVAVIVQTWKWALLSDCLFRVLHALVVILNVLIELLESPYFNSGVVRARNKCVGLFNVLHLVNPVHVAIEVRQQPGPRFLSLILAKGDWPKFDKAVPTCSKQNGLLLVLQILCICAHAQGVWCEDWGDGFSVFDFKGVSEHDWELALFRLLSPHVESL